MDYVHDHNVGMYCNIIPRRAALAVIATGFFLAYLIEILTWIIFARRLYEIESLPASHCFGVRCPSEFSCTFQLETTLLFRFAFEVIVGVVCAFFGILGAFYWDAQRLKVFGYYLAFLAMFTLVLSGFDMIFDVACGSYPANMLAVMPVLSHIHDGRREIAELHMAPTAELDEIFGYKVGPMWYFLRTLLVVCIYGWIAGECLAAAHCYEYGRIGLGPNFSISDPSGKINHWFNDFRVDLVRAHGRGHSDEVVGGYGATSKEASGKL